MTPLRNGEIADLFDLLGDLYELDGAVVYRVLAYRRAAKRFRETAESVWTLSEQGRLTELDDIGDTIATKVGELRETGTMAALEKLRGRVPESLVEIVRLPGLGAKTARRLWQELGITTLAELEAAAREGRLRGLAGLRRAQGAAAAGAARGGRGAAQARLPARPGARPRTHRARAAARASRLRAGRRGGVAAPPRRDGGRRRRDRRGQRRPRADRVADRAAVRRRGARPRHDEGLDPDPQRRPARPARRAARELRQPAAALHGLEGPQRAHARGGAAARHEHLGVGHRGRRERRGVPDAATRTRSTATSATSRSRPSCARTTASWSWRAPNELPELVEAGDMRGDLHTAQRLERRRQALAARSSSRPCGRAGTSTWRSPTTRPAWAWASASRPTTCAARSRRCSASARRSTASSCWRAARSTSWATARSICPTTSWTSSTGSSPRCTSRSGRRPTASPSGCWPRPSIRASTSSAIPPGA